MVNIKKLREQLKELDSTKIFFTDLNGRLMSLPVNPDNIESIISNGIGFDGSSVAGYATVMPVTGFFFPIRRVFVL